MKQIILSVLILMCTLGLNNSMAQNIQRQGNTFTISKISKENQDKQTKFTWQDSKGVKYPIYISKTGSCYIKKVSKKTGKEYKQYLGKEISAQISKEMGIKYEPKK